VVDKFRMFVASAWFFRLIVVSFVLQAAWIAFSAVYPQAFDEDFHFGIIQTYSHHWLPFLSSQPAGADAYGAVYRDPSFLYHYLMSFPYRLIELFTRNQVAQIISLRVIDIGLFALGLILFRKLLLRVGLSQRLTNLSLFVMVFIPIVPQLAGQINYDNLLMPLTAWALLLALDLIDQLNQHHFSLQSTLKLLTVCLLATMVKYEFLPIFVAIVAYLSIRFWRESHGRWPDAKGLLGSYRRHPWSKKSIVLLAFVMALAMFIQRDVVNLLKYHNVAPDCGYVLSIENCSAYPVWSHDYISHQQVIGHSVSVGSNPVWYVWEWIYWLWYRLFFAINGPLQGFVNYPPLPLPIAAFGLLIIGSVAAVIRYHRRLFIGNPYFVFLGLTVVLYLLALLSQGFLKYRHTAVLELMNGRYLLPILLPAMAIGATAVYQWLRHRPKLQAGLAAAVILAFLQGGGVLTFISRSDASWYWDNQTVRDMNQAAQSVVHPLIYEGSKTYYTSKWFFN
jgi:hypothetical protein